MLYPIGTQSFEIIRNGGFVYVDKTDLVHKLANSGRIYFLSRPRRFGKSLLVSTLRAYFEGRKDLFEGLAMENLETEWTKYPIFHFDFNGNNFTEKGTLEKHIKEFLSNYEMIYIKEPIKETIGGRFKDLLEAAAKQTGQKCVILIDEYDKPILDVLDTPLENENREILKGFYSTFKGADASLRFVLLTGVTKFSQVSVFSGFNQPEDISRTAEYETICGITEPELHTVFAEQIQDLADENGCSADEMKDMLKRKYDGYHFSKKMTDIYNPFSILNALKSKSLEDFWFASGTPTYLVKLLNHFNENIAELTSKYYEAAAFADYKADIEQPLPMIYQSGYLTIKGYDAKRNKYLLDFPNKEVSNGFLSVLSAGYFKNNESDTSNVVDELCIALTDGNVDSFIEQLSAFLSSIPYDAHDSLKDIKATERHFQYTFYIIFRLMGGTNFVHNEKSSSFGRADCILEMKDYVYIFEYKLDGDAQEALAQIDSKGYAAPYATDSRKVVKIGISFSSETMTIGNYVVV